MSIYRVNQMSYQIYNELGQATTKPHNIDRCVVAVTHILRYDNKP